MRYIVLDTDVVSRVIKWQLAGPLAAKLTGAAWCVTFVTRAVAVGRDAELGAS